MAGNRRTVPNHLTEGLDLAVLERICRSSTVSPHKKKLGCDFERQISRAWKRAKRLDLDSSPPLDVLEIGIGPGYFLHVCQRLGHRVVGIDRPALKFWRDVCHWLGVEHIIDHSITPNTPLPVNGKRFDLVVSYECPFNYVRSEDRLWNLPEWNFFFDHLRDDVLKPTGRLVLQIRYKKVGGRIPKQDEAELFDTVCRSRGGSGDGITVFNPLL
jgi:SAM-dependent methyltransferase